MSPAELATLILMLCGAGEGDEAVSCRDHMVNCAVNRKGEITEADVIKCAEATK